MRIRDLISIAVNMADQYGDDTEVVVMADGENLYDIEEVEYNGDEDDIVIQVSDEPKDN